MTMGERDAQMEKRSGATQRESTRVAGVLFRVVRPVDHWPFQHGDIFVVVEPRPQWDAEKARCLMLTAVIILPPGQRLVVYDSVRICTGSQEMVAELEVAVGGRDDESCCGRERRIVLVIRLARRRVDFVSGGAHGDEHGEHPEASTCSSAGVSSPRMDRRRAIHWAA